MTRDPAALRAALRLLQEVDAAFEKGEGMVTACMAVRRYLAELPQRYGSDIQRSPLTNDDYTAPAEPLDVDLLQTVAESMGITASIYINRRLVWERVAAEYARMVAAAPPALDEVSNDAADPDV